MRPKHISAHNRSIILEVIRSEGLISRAEIGRKTNLSAPSITRIVKDLMRERLIKEVGTGKSGGGRKPCLLALNADSKYIIGVALGEIYSVSVLAARVVQRLSKEAQAVLVLR